jgi:hypothetical protein
MLAIMFQEFSTVAIQDGDKIFVNMAAMSHSGYGMNGNISE